MGQRIEWIDYSKGLGMFLVMFAHLPIPLELQHYIYTFHMPLFFFLSGYLYCHDKQQDFKSFVYKKFKSLLVPYFCFSIIIYFFWLQSVLGYDIIGVSYNGLLIRPLVCSILGLRDYNGTLWFIACLFVTEIFFYILLSKLKDNKRRIVIFLMAFSAVGYFYSSKISYALPWSCDVALTAVVFYGSGYMIKNNIKNKWIYNHIIKIWLVLFLLNFAFGMVNDRIDMYSNKYNNYIFFYAAAFSGIGQFLILARLIKTLNFFLYIGKNSIIFLALHQQVIFPIFKKTINSITPLSIYLTQHSMIYGLVITVSTVIICYPIIKLINNYLYFALGKREPIGKAI